jgi:hypothetical protein
VILKRLDAIITVANVLPQQLHALLLLQLVLLHPLKKLNIVWLTMKQVRILIVKLKMMEPFAFQAQPPIVFLLFQMLLEHSGIQLQLLMRHIVKIIHQLIRKFIVLPILVV